MVPSRDWVDLALKGKECQSSVAPDIFFCEVDSSPLLREECLYIPRVLDHFSVAQDLPAPYAQIHCLDAEGTIHFDCMVQSVVAGVLEKVHCQELCDCLRTCWRLLTHINPFSWHIVESWNKIERNPGGLFANVPQKGWIYHSRISYGCLVNFYFVIFCWTFVLRHVIPSESIGQMQFPFVRPNLLHNLSAATFGGTQRP